MEYYQSVQAETNDLPAPNVREAVGVFMSPDALHDAVVELDLHFPRHAISVLGSKKDIEEKFGSTTVPPVIAEMAQDTPLQAPVRDEEKTIGTAAFIGVSTYVGAMAVALAAGAVTVPATIAAAIIGGSSGAAISTILAKIFGDNYNKDIEEQIAKGGLLLWVQTLDHQQEELASNIMSKHGARHVKIIVHDSGVSSS